MRGLGATDGPATACTWTPPNPLPSLIPWLAILILLVLPRNRTARAWWIWAPLACVFLLKLAMQTVFTFIPSEALDMFCDIVQSLALGIAAIWLLAPYLTKSARFVVHPDPSSNKGRADLPVGPNPIASEHRDAGDLAGKNLAPPALEEEWAAQQRRPTMSGVPKSARFVAGLKVFLTLATFSVGTYAIGHNWRDSNGQEIGVLIFFSIAAVVMATALCLAGFNCRRRFHPLRFLLWLALWLVVCSMLALLPFAVMAFSDDGSQILGPFAGFSLVASAVCFAMLLPFLVLSFGNGFYRERLQALLRWGDAALPPAISSPSSGSNERLSP